MHEQVLCISYFDQIIGPNTFYCTEQLADSVEEPDLGKILEFNDEPGTFIFAFRKYQTLNHIFFIKSDIARGGQELLMISFLIKSAYFKNEILDVFKFLESKERVLEDYANHMKEWEELPEILHTSKKGSIKSVLDLATEDFREKFLNVHNAVLKRLSPKQEIQPDETKPELKKLFIFGARNAGKTTFLKNVEAIQFHAQDNNDLPTRIYEMVIENLEILTYDCVDREYTCDKCKNYGGCISNAQGFVMMLDTSNEDTLEEAEMRFRNLVNRCDEIETDKVPILIIGNITKKKEQISADMIEKRFTIPELKECGMKIKYFPINVLRDEEKIMEALRWLVRKMI